MPKLFVPNAEEALPYLDASFAEFFRSKTLKMFPRFLCSLHPGDILASPVPIEPVFAEYICTLMGLGRPDDVIIKVKLADSCLLGESILSDPRAVSEIKRRCSGDGWALEPYMQTRAMHELGEALGLKTLGTPAPAVNSDLIEDLNDKDFCKGLGTGARCHTVNGLKADNLNELSVNIYRLSRHLPDPKHSKIMLRKIKFAGGAGNLSGTADELLAKIDSWYSTGRVLIEPFLDFAGVCGSLSLITDDGAEFIALDSQVFKNGSWCGFNCPPSIPEDCQEAIKEGAGRIGSSLHWAKARGYMNLDWGLLRSDSAAGGLKPVLLECNFRHNGFSYITDLAAHCFGSSWKEMHISSRESVPASVPDTKTLLQTLAFLTYDGEPLLLRGKGSKRGLILTSPLLHGGAGFAAFGETPECCEEILKLAAQAAGTGLSD